MKVDQCILIVKKFNISTFNLKSIIGWFIKCSVIDNYFRCHWLVPCFNLIYTVFIAKFISILDKRCLNKKFSSRSEDIIRISVIKKKRWLRRWKIKASLPMTLASARIGWICNKEFVNLPTRKYKIPKWPSHENDSLQELPLFE